MRFLGSLVVLLSVVVLLAGIVGMGLTIYYAHEYNVDMDMVDGILEAGSWFGVQNHVSAEAQLQMFLISNRMMLLVAGGCGLVVGIVMRLLGRK